MYRTERQGSGGPGVGAAMEDAMDNNNSRTLGRESSFGNTGGGTRDWLNFGGSGGPAAGSGGMMERPMTASQNN